MNLLNVKKLAGGVMLLGSCVLFGANSANAQYFSELPVPSENLLLGQNYQYTPAEDGVLTIVYDYSISEYGNLLYAGYDDFLDRFESPVAPLYISENYKEWQYSLQADKTYFLASRNLYYEYSASFSFGPAVEVPVDMDFQVSVAGQTVTPPFSQFTVTNSSTSVISNGSSFGLIKIFNGAGGLVSEASQFSNGVVTLFPEISTPGDYTINFPEGAFLFGEDGVLSIEKTVTFSIASATTTPERYFDELPVPAENLNLYQSYQYTPAEDGILTIVYNYDMSDLGNLMYYDYDGYSFYFNVDPLQVSDNNKEWQYELEAGVTYYFAAKYCWGEYTAVSITFEGSGSTPEVPRYFDELPVPAENLNLYKSYQFTPDEDGVLTIVYNYDISDLGNLLYADYNGGSFSSKVEPVYVSSNNKEWQYELEAGKTYYLASQYCWGEYTAVSITFEGSGSTPEVPRYFDELPVPAENLNLYKSYQFTPDEDGVLTIIYNYDISDLGNLLYADYNGGSFSSKVEPIYVSSNNKEWQYELEAGKTYYLASQYCWGEYTAVSITFDDETTAVGRISDRAESLYKVYDLNGVNVMTTDKAADLNSLNNGLYIVNGKKLIIRK